MGLTNRRTTSRPLFSPADVRRRVKMRLGTTSASTWRDAIQVFRGRCAYCRSDAHPLQRDHVIPLSRGGLDVPANVVPACEACNTSKGDSNWRSWMRARGYDPNYFFLLWRRLRGNP
jgi:5-methylcytosine-specific restriction endonuclease McrA